MWKEIDFRLDFEAALTRLTPAEAKIQTMRRQGFTHDEIAVILKMSRPHVFKLDMQGRAVLRAFLGDYYDGRDRDLGLQPPGS
jgi:DNA-directed RNA polymerase specialized sigma24 family protein